MPLIIPRDIPAFELLKNHAFVIDNERAKCQDIRTLEVLIINLMPIKIETENQILSLLANSPLQVNVTLLSTESYVGTNTPKSHLDRFYVNFSDIRGRNFDGAIVTGAPIERMAFEEVAYWNELVNIMSYLKQHCTSTLYLCWGAMAGLYYFHKIPKIAMPQKVFGVFAHHIVENDSLLTGIDEIVKIPHSRYSGVDELSIKQSSLKILLEGEESGISVIKDEKDYFILAHPEYAKDTLLSEYERDQKKGLEIAKPVGYFNDKGEPNLSWKSSASVMFANWLNFSVYQNTPYIL